MATTGSSESKTTLLRGLSGAFSGKGWQGPTLLGSLRGVSAREAAIRPPLLKHGIWDLVLHAAYWKYVVVYKLGAAERDSFPYSPSNWPSLPSEKSRPGKPDDRAWRADIKLLKDYHDQLMLAVEAFDPASSPRSRPAANPLATSTSSSASPPTMPTTAARSSSSSAWCGGKPKFLAGLLNSS